jgi:hypothetical protein
MLTTPKDTSITPVHQAMNGCRPYAISMKGITKRVSPNRKAGVPIKMKSTDAHQGVGGVYRVPHALQIRTAAKATLVAGWTCL